MQTETRSTKKEEGTTLRRDRPRQFDAGIRIQGETAGGQPFAGSWGQSYQEPAYQGFGSQQQGGYWPAEQQVPFSQGFGQGFTPPYTNPMAAVAPTLSYGLAGLADLVYRGVALATSQGQALINSVRPMQANLTSRNQPVAWPSARLPATDIVDEGAELVCQIELPGVKQENVEVSCFGRGLLVTAHSEPEIDLGALVQAERGVETTYRRAINLPVPIQPSGAKATLRDGILTVNLPKANPTEAPRRIPVSSAH
ncbi:MAG: Hsp20/alpha crystallin family protein [Thermoplasmatota archaeon]